LQNNFNNIPKELKAVNQWVNWVDDKTPINSKTLRGASSSNKATWSSYTEAVGSIGKTATYTNGAGETLKAITLGVGFCLGNGFAAVDIDDHYGEGIPQSILDEFVESLNTYCEYSRSGKGFHIIGRSKEEPVKKRSKLVPFLEFYASSRYLIMTGNVYADKAVNDFTENFLKLNSKYMPTDAPDINLNSECHRDVQRKNSGKIEDGLRNDKVLISLWNGERTSSDESSNDIALMNKLAYWCNRDIDRMISEFKSSPYATQKDAEHIKKMNRADYLNRTAKEAISKCRSTAEKDSEDYLMVNGFSVHLANNIYTGKEASPKIDDSQHGFAEIIPFDELELPEFPTNCFPEWLSNYVKAVAEDTQTPEDLASVIGLSVVATTLAGKIKIEGKPGWQEPLNIYTAAIMNPAERKSSVFNHMAKPLIIYEAEINSKLKIEIAESKVEKEILENTLRNMKAAAAKKNDFEAKEKAKELGRQLEAFEEKRPVRILADDVSPEKVSGLLSENNARMSIMSAEGGIFEIMAGRYSSNGGCNIDVFLKGHSGDMLRVDRVGRPPDHVDDPALTMGLAIQPDVLTGVMDNSSFRGRGLTARFLFSMPKSKVGSRNIKSNPIPEQIKNEYFKNINILMSTSQNEVMVMKESGLVLEKEVNILRLSVEAEEKSFQFAQEMEPRLVDDLESIKDWAGKLHGAVLRIAGILHCSTYVGIENFWDIEVSEDTLTKAIIIGRYFIEHNRAAFGLMGADPQIENAKLILKYIKKQGISKFTKRDIQRGNRTRFKRAEDIDPALNLLLDSNYINEYPVAYNGIGRKPQSIYIANPLLLK
jgi:hypothetical protein